MDRKLDELLAGYKVKDAEAALVDRIVAKAQGAGRGRYGVWQQCAMFAVIAALGFWLGNLQGQKLGAAQKTAVTATQDSSSGGAGAQILGPDSLNDLML